MKRRYVERSNEKISLHRKQKMKKEKLSEVMGNVMAALNTFGIEYDTNTSGFGVKRKVNELKTEETIEYLGFDGGDNFKTKFFKFIEEPHYSNVRGAYWADDGKYVIIQFSRLYEMSAEDWQNYADWCGYDTPEEAQCQFGEPTSSYIRMNMRVAKGNIESFLMRYAQYFWKY